MPSRRMERVAAMLKHEIATVITQELNDPTLGFVTITEVRPAPDLSVAKVFISAMGDADAQASAMKVLFRARKHIQVVVAQRVRLRIMPVLLFRSDDRIKKSLRIAELLADYSEDRDADGNDGEIDD